MPTGQSEERYLTIENFDSVIAYIPSLEQQQPRDLLRAFCDNGFVSLPFAASQWGYEAQRYMANPHLVATADLETCVKLITFHQRGDYWEYGHFDDMVRSGHILAIVRRLAVLRNELHFPVKQPRIGPPPEEEVVLQQATTGAKNEPDPYVPEGSIAGRGQLSARPGMYRVVTVDTFEGPFADHLVGDFATLEEAKTAAALRVGGMVIARL
jgi:hypothetical protein